MKKTVNIEFSLLEIDTILTALQREIHSDIEILNIDNAALNPAGETFQTFLSIINDMNDVYLKLTETIKPAEENEE